jgi:hypothetical protein
MKLRVAVGHKRRGPRESRLEPGSRVTFALPTSGDCSPNVPMFEVKNCQFGWSRGKGKLLN